MNAVAALLNNQQEAMARSIAAKFNISVEDVVAFQKAHTSQIDISTATKGKRKRKSKSGGSRKIKEIDPEHRCCARVWRTGSGKDQCSNRKLEGDDYCKRHGHAAAIGKTPCVRLPFAEDNSGKKQGLFFGDIRKAIPIADDQGVVRIRWDSKTADESLIQMMEDKVASGEWRYESHTIKDGSKKKTKKVAAPSAVEKTAKDALESMMDGSKSPSQKADAESVGSSNSLDDLIKAGEVIEAGSEEVDGASSKVEDDAESSNGGDDEEEAAEDALEVEEKEFGGETYLVDMKTMNIYNEDADVIGTWSEEGPQLD